ncbi:uncharacterized protein MONBRDRAFT_9931 [Monosiga brevicollis MX1]|uniref:Transmembrane protein 14C n=1 Tax=Monosiga brevicollis TaxID=81824 RepID=A9V4P1_MONBE|nr:uncharacterized protein MONBRDRAFT_9931 [Monosiga brevicollis MX1]EDQ87403.1 predicted protein [Monosiga brevicollis MX1]|eukprot:XP_001747663.1 hypothetical protein [Monosiga brevicollis MX1]
MAHHINMTVGSLVMAGGVAGYIKKRSKASLIAGVSTGLMYFGTAYLLTHDQEQLGHDLAVGLSIVLGGAMAKRCVAQQQYDSQSSCPTLHHLVQASLPHNPCCHLPGSAVTAGKFMPGGAVAILAGVAAVYNANKSYEWRNGISF